MTHKKITESDSEYRHLEKMSTLEILSNINQEDQKIPNVISAAIPSIELLVKAVTEKMEKGGRLFYIGAGTSGRLGVVDASECPPTFGIPEGHVIAVIAGGKEAFTKAVEFAEDDAFQGWKDLEAHTINAADFVIGLSASGSTPYVLHALEKCKQQKIHTGCICCNPHSPIAAAVDFPVEIVVGPEFITGSTRLKAGTAQKLVLNMISSTVMIKLGRIEDNKMLHVQLANEKLIDRAVKMAMKLLESDDYEEIKSLLLQAGTVKKLIEKYKS